MTERVKPVEANILPPRQTIHYQDGFIHFLDQTLLPHTERVITTNDWSVVADAIRRLAIRGAPLIGVSAALAVACYAHKQQSVTKSNILVVIESLWKTRPTAVNLFWALNRMREVVNTTPDEQLGEALECAAVEIWEDDKRRCRRIGEAGQSLIPSQANILTVCNTGWLATAGLGTALANVYVAAEMGKDIHLYSVETRPLLQGARLTAWEASRAGIRVTTLVDSAAAGLCREGRINLCIIGADRIAANGDTANKIGSYHLALACKAHNIPFYVAAPFSTVDPDCPSASAIPIEQRDGVEVTTLAGCRIAPEGVLVYNPAFDIVPSELITCFVTDQGLIHPPYRFTKEANH